MNEEFQLKLQAFLDGELSEKEKHAVETTLASDSEARALLAELKNTNAAFAIFAQETKLPESREFFWSKIQREIRSQEARPVANASTGFSTLLRRFLVPAGSFAALVLVGFLAFKQIGGTSKIADLSGGVEVAMSDSEAFTYNDHAAGMTVVWLSYPAENEFTEVTPEDTLQ